VWLWLICWKISISVSAINVLSESVSKDPGQLKRFHREAEVAAKLELLNIATVYAFEEFDDTQFIVMEYVEGKTLRDMSHEDKEQIYYSISGKITR